jgi:WD40 repeat protein
MAAFVPPCCLCLRSDSQLYNGSALSTRAQFEAVSSPGRLDSWKDIAAYLNRSVRTVRRWEEQQKLPVHRVGHQKGASVYAYKTELDAWWDSHKLQDQSTQLSDNKSLRVFVERSVGGRNSSVDATLPTPSATRPAHIRFYLWLLAAVGGVLIAISGIRHIPNRDSESLTVTPLTAFPGEEVQPSLSPDGNQVAFAFDGGRSSNYDIYVKTVGSEKITRLTSDPADDMSPSWSPDGQNIAFLRFLSDQSALVMVIPSAGGAERQLAKLQVERDETEIRAAWSPDGEWIATSDAETSLSRMRLILVSAVTGRKRRLAYQSPTADADLSPSFSPDGRYLAYARHLSLAIADIFVVEVTKEGGPTGRGAAGNELEPDEQESGLVRGRQTDFLCRR